MTHKLFSSIVCLTLLAGVTAEAKIVRRTLGILQTSVPESKIIAKSNMEFIYEYYFNADTVSNHSSDKEQMILQAGDNGMSKFSSYRNMRVDSLINTIPEDQLIANAEKLANGPFITIYKNYPQGRLTHVEKICMDWFRYEEDVPVMEWTLTDSTRTILGYECHGAVCDFRGRRWHAYYCEDIPLMDGPWKLNGLPGLIMYASDDKGDYRFECIGMSGRERDITIYDVPYNNTSRKKFYDTLHRYDTNPYGYAQSVMGIQISVTDSAGNPDPTAFDPMDLNYDYPERDWRAK